MEIILKRTRPLFPLHPVCLQSYIPPPIDDKVRVDCHLFLNGIIFVAPLFLHPQITIHGVATVADATVVQFTHLPLSIIFIQLLCKFISLSISNISLVFHFCSLFAQITVILFCAVFMITTTSVIAAPLVLLTVLLTQLISSRALFDRIIAWWLIKSQHLLPSLMRRMNDASSCACVGLPLWTFLSSSVSLLPLSQPLSPLDCWLPRLLLSLAMPLLLLVRFVPGTLSLPVTSSINLAGDLNAILPFFSSSRRWLC